MDSLDLLNILRTKSIKCTPIRICLLILYGLILCSASPIPQADQLFSSLFGGNSPSSSDSSQKPVVQGFSTVETNINGKKNKSTQPFNMSNLQTDEDTTPQTLTKIDPSHLGSLGQPLSSSSEKSNPMNIGLPTNFGNLGNLLSNLFGNDLSFSSKSGNEKPSIKTWSTTETNINGKKNVKNHHYDSDNPNGNQDDNKSFGDSSLGQNESLPIDYAQTPDTTSNTPVEYGLGEDGPSRNGSLENIGSNLDNGGVNSTDDATSDQNSGSYPNAGNGGGGGSPGGYQINQGTGNGGGSPGGYQSDQNTGNIGGGGSSGGYQLGSNNEADQTNGTGGGGDSTTSGSNGEENGELQDEDCSEEEE
ncbi:hypothetical protein DFH28DRAFT_1125305 [Melampsora americana]|nr:hypothetical protein DFH28DRAFT_1125305 [Melampsora americana]